MKTWIVMMLCCLWLGFSHQSNLAQDEVTPYELALQRITEAESSDAVNLDLSGLDLEELPPEIGSLSKLQVLHLNDNALSNLPPEIGNLSELQWLNLNKNSLISLPHEIGNLSNLLWLYLNGNSLSSLPSEINQLSKLCYIDLRNNRFESYPLEFYTIEADQRCFPEIDSFPISIINAGIELDDSVRNSPPKNLQDAWQRFLMPAFSFLGAFSLIGIVYFVFSHKGKRKRKRKNDELFSL